MVAWRGTKGTSKVNALLQISFLPLFFVAISHHLKLRMRIIIWSLRSDGSRVREWWDGTSAWYSVAY
jgi:hypothetical protein